MADRVPDHALVAHGWRAVLLRLVRSAGAGGVATLVDLGSLTILVSLVGMSPRAASVPALTLGSVAMFFLQKHFAFRSHGGTVRREAILFAVVQLIGLGLNALLYEGVMRVSPFAAHWYVAARLVTTNVVWLGFSFPAWHYVFRTDATQAPRLDRGDRVLAPGTASTRPPEP